MNLILIILTSFFIGVILFPVLIKVLTKYNFLDAPGGRRIHTESIPSVGGLIILFSTFFSLLIYNIKDFGDDLSFVCAGIVLMLVLGISDDFIPLKAYQKILVQLLAVYFFVHMGGERITSLNGFLGLYKLNDWISYVFSGFIILVLMNAFNLIDGIDGLAGSVSIVFFLFFGVIFWISKFYFFSLLSFSMTGGIVSFLIYNWHPAKIFMGDTGSLPLGYLMGCFTVFFLSNPMAMSLPKDFPVISLSISLVIYPLFDMARVFWKRMFLGLNPMRADKRHLHHLLLRVGFKQKFVVLFALGFQMLITSIVVLLKNLDDHFILLITSFMVISFWILLEVYSKKIVKKYVSTKPRILEIKEMKRINMLKEIIKDQSLNSGSMNLN